MALERRIFRIPETPHNEYWVLEIDDEFVRFKRYLYGLLREEMVRGHDFLLEKFPAYRSMPFEDWANLNAHQSQIEDLQSKEKSDDPIIQKMRERLLANLKAQSNFFSDMHAKMDGLEEVTEKAFFDPQVGLMLPDEYGHTWIAERFSPALRNIIALSMESEVFDPAPFAALYISFERNFRALRPRVLQLLRHRFEEVVKETDYGVGWTPPVIHSDEEVEPMMSFTDLFLHPEGFGLRGRCDWDQEHGFHLLISPDFEITLEH